MKNVHELAPDLEIHSLVGESTSHLVVRGGSSLLVNCHSPQFGRWLEHQGLPSPEIILHTHVEPGKCREADRFPEARILVHEEAVELAGDRAGYERATRTRWERPEEWGLTLGREEYGVAGSITEFPPQYPLKVAGTFLEGERIEWQDLVFEVIPLPGHGRHHVGFVLELAGEPLAIFTGDLMCDGARLVNLYDLEVNYGGTALLDLPAVLRRLAARPVRTYFSSTGPVINDGPDQALALADAIDAYHQAVGWQSGLFSPAPQPDYPRVGRYLRLHKGVYQLDNLGNCIVLIDDEGRGLMFDPGPCDYESPTRRESFQNDLALLERECGLREIDLAIITHFHGDHYDMTPDLKRRYPRCRVAAWDLVARVMEAPWDYPYPALLPWYNVGVDHVAVDDVLRVGEPFFWHGTAISTIHLPGHCYVHAAYLLSFNGLRLAVTGDTIQSHGDSDGINFGAISNHSIPDGQSGILKSYMQMVDEDVDLNLGGHGSHFTQCKALYAESLRRIEHALPFLRRLVPGGDLDAALLRPGMPRWPSSEPQFSQEASK
jgi:glyoxylase-like metal-dependent hydrolase (beta-lactamase superfamily II)